MNSERDVHATGSSTSRTPNEPNARPMTGNTREK